MLDKAFKLFNFVLPSFLLSGLIYHYWSYFLDNLSYLSTNSTIRLSKTRAKNHISLSLRLNTKRRCIRRFIFLLMVYAIVVAVLLIILLSAVPFPLFQYHKLWLAHFYCAMKKNPPLNSFIDLCVYYHLLSYPPFPVQARDDQDSIERQSADFYGLDYVNSIPLLALVKIEHIFRCWWKAFFRLD